MNQYRLTSLCLLLFSLVLVDRLIVAHTQSATHQHHEIVDEHGHRAHELTGPASYVIVIDVTSTLLVNQQSIRNDVPGFVNGTLYALSKWTTKPAEAIEQDFRNLMESFGRQNAPADLVIRDPEGRAVAKLLVDWLSGAQHSAQVVQQICLYAEYGIFRDIAKTVFNDHVIAKHTHPVASMVQCVEQCLHKVHSDQLYLIGNWDAGSFSIISRAPHTQSILSKIAPQHRFISGSTHQLLPRDAQALFKRVADTAHVPLDHIIFVSTMPYHIAAAQRAGVHAVALLPHNMSLTLQTIFALLQC